MDLIHSLLSTQPRIALRDRDTDARIVELVREPIDTGVGVLLVEVDYLWQLLGVCVTPQALELKETLSPRDLVSHLVQRLEEDCNWKLRDPYYGALQLSVDPSGVFTFFVGGTELGCGQIFKAGKIEFDYFTHFELNPRSDRLLSEWLAKRLDASLVKKSKQLTLFASTLVIDLTNRFQGGILASVESAKDYRTLYRLTADSDHHTIVIKLPDNLKFISREFLAELLKDTVGDLSYVEYRNKYLFAGFEKHQRLLEDAIKMIIKEHA